MGLVSSLLSKVTGFFSNPFLIGAFLPVVLALTVNAALLCWFYEPARLWVTANWAGDMLDKLTGSLVVLLPVFVFSYVFWSINPGLLAVLEGRGLPGFVTRNLKEWQRERFNSKQQQVDEARDGRRALSGVASRWEVKLREARKKGASQPTDTYSTTLKELEALREKRNYGDPIEPKAVVDACAAIEIQLQNNNADIANPSGQTLLDRDHIDIIRLMKYAAGRAEGEYLQSFTERDQNFSYFRLAATKMGNMAESVRSYSLSRYEMDIDIFWSRLLSVIREEKETAHDGFADFLADQKGQLDFLVALFWLSLLSNLTMVLSAALLSWNLVPLFAIVILGPFFPIAFYQLAVTKYRDFADVQRTAIDLFRLKLLGRFNLPAPRCTEDERRLWQALTQMLRYRDDINLPFIDQLTVASTSAASSVDALRAQIMGGK